MTDSMVVIDFRGAPGVSGEPPWTIVTAAAQMAPGARYAADSTAGAFTLTLPPLANMAAGAEIQICDIGGDAAVNPIAIAPGAAGDLINGAAANASLAAARGMVRLIVNAARTSWEVVAG